MIGTGMRNMSLEYTLRDTQHGSDGLHEDATMVYGMLELHLDSSSPYFSIVLFLRQIYTAKP